MKTMLITGASSDIGLRYIAQLEEDASPCVVLAQYYTNAAQLVSLQKKCKHVQLKTFPCDLRDESAVSAWLNDLEAGSFQPSHILHLAAQRIEYVRFRQFDWDNMKGELEIQVHALIEIAKRFLPSMVKMKFGKIVVMLSACTLGVPPKFLSDYTMVKYTLLGLVKSLASEYRGKGININAVSPNMIETKFLWHLDPKAIEINAMQSAMKRNITVEEVAAAVDFLFSDAASYINGVNLNLSGGDVM